MSDRLGIVTREATGPEPNPQGLIAELRVLVLEMFPHTAQSGALWLRGKGEAEMAKAAELRASAMERLGKLEIERQKLIQERDIALQGGRHDHAQKMYDLRTQRLKEVIAALRALKEMGGTISARLCTKVNDMLIASLGDDD